MSCWLNTGLATRLVLVLIFGLASCERNLSVSPTNPPGTAAALSSASTLSPVISTTSAPAAPAAPTPSPAARQSLTPTALVFPTLVPTFGSGWRPESLRQTYQISSGAETNGHRLVRISSPVYGLRSPGYCQEGPYRWMDDTHLLLFPLVGQEEGMGISDWSYPLVADLDQQQTWLPEITGSQPIRDCKEEPVWSAARKRLYSPMDGKILVYRPDGSLEQAMEGSGPLLLSPSGKHLLTGEAWIDLESGQRVAHSLQQADVFTLGWSSDETRLFGCCYQFFDAATGQTSRFELGSLHPVGRGVTPGFTGVESTWVVSDTYATIKWDMQSDDDFGQVPLIVADTQAYIDLRDMAGLSPNTPCQLMSISPDRLKVWLNCGSGGGRLVDLTTFKFRAFPSNPLFLGWSADSRAGLVEDGYNWRVFSAPSGDWASPAIPAGRSAAWSPLEHRLAAISRDGTQLTFWDPETQASPSLSLPGTYTSLAWAPDGHRLGLQNSDGSLWLLQDPGGASVEQLTPAMPQVGALRWSPSGERLAFTSGPDLYIVR